MMNCVIMIRLCILSIRFYLLSYYSLITFLHGLWFMCLFWPSLFINLQKGFSLDSGFSLTLGSSWHERVILLLKIKQCFVYHVWMIPLLFTLCTVLGWYFYIMHCTGRLDGTFTVYIIRCSQLNTLRCKYRSSLVVEY